MGIKAKIQQALGRSAPYVEVLPVPISVNRAPATSDVMPAGQLFIDTSVTPNVVYTSLGNGTFAESSVPAAFVAPGSITATTSLTATLGNITATNGNIVKGTAGNKDVYTSVATTTAAGANSAGTVTLVAGEAVIATTAVTASSIIRLYRQGIGATGANGLGNLTILTRTAGTSFTIRAVTLIDSTAAETTDVSVVAWEIVN